MLIPDQLDKDLGTLKFGVPYSFIYKLKNTAQQPANIQQLFVGCSSCTTVSIGYNIVVPGDTVNLTAIFTPGSTGINVKSISVSYITNGKVLTLALKFKANVIA